MSEGFDSGYSQPLRSEGGWKMGVVVAPGSLWNPELFACILMAIEFWRLYRGNQDQQLLDIVTPEVAILQSCCRDNRVIRPRFTTVTQVIRWEWKLRKRQKPACCLRAFGE